MFVAYLKPVNKSDIGCILIKKQFKLHKINDHLFECEYGYYLIAYVVVGFKGLDLQLIFAC